MLVILITSCQSYYYQVFNTKCVNCDPSSSVYSSQRDSVYVEYNFWANRGVVGFTIYNTTSRPIYVDWKRSGLYINNSLNKYWEDEIKSTVTSVGKSVQVPFYLSRNPMIIGSSYSVTNTNGYKPERVSFVVNNAHYSPPYVYYLYPGEVRLMPNDTLTKYSRQNMDGTYYPVYYRDYSDMKSSDLVFRNYITWSYSESGEDAKTIDNTFYVTSIKEMRDKFFSRHSTNDPKMFYMVIPYNAAYIVRLNTYY
jgi:hypothetical protein